MNLSELSALVTYIVLTIVIIDIFRRIIRTITGLWKKEKYVSGYRIARYHNNLYAYKPRTAKKNSFRIPYSEEIIDVEDAIDVDEFYEWLRREGYIRS